ncbi:MAG: vanadium-dependent haloperoxidase [Burkholderiales bacterium]
MVSVAMHDALGSALRLGLGEAGQRAALHSAASRTLSYLFPSESADRLKALGFSALSALATAHVREATEISQGAYIGERVAALIVDRALYDGADEVWDARERPVWALWRATPPMESAFPQEPLAGNWRTWVLADGRELQAPAPPSADSRELSNAAKEVLDISRKLSAAQKKIASDWHLEQGTVTPPGIWNRKLMSLANRHKFSERQRVVVYAALNVAMMDAAISCWQAKYTWWTARPITIIREQLDPEFQSYLVTPTHPSYVSGHAAVSGAAAEILKLFFPSEKRRVDAWATEAAISRLYGGIHFRFDNEAGLALGRLVGKRVVEKLKGDR